MPILTTGSRQIGITEVHIKSYMPEAELMITCGSATKIIVEPSKTILKFCQKRYSNQLKIDTYVWHVNILQIDEQFRSYKVVLT